MFKETHIDLGTIAPKTPHRIDYVYNADVKRILKITSSCDCSNPYIVKNKNLVRVDYVSNPVPKHLTDGGTYEYATIKKIIVEYENMFGEKLTQLLTFSALVKQN